MSRHCISFTNVHYGFQNMYFKIHKFIGLFYTLKIASVANLYSINLTKTKCSVGMNDIRIYTYMQKQEFYDFNNWYVGDLFIPFSKLQYLGHGKVGVGVR